MRVGGDCQISTQPNDFKSAGSGETAFPVFEKETCAPFTALLGGYFSLRPQFSRSISQIRYILFMWVLVVVRARAHACTFTELACSLSGSLSPSLSLSCTHTCTNTERHKRDLKPRHKAKKLQPSASWCFLTRQPGAGGACPSAFPSGRRVGFVLFCAALLG